MCSSFDGNALNDDRRHVLYRHSMSSILEREKNLSTFLCTVLLFYLSSLCCLLCCVVPCVAHSQCFNVLVCCMQNHRTAQVVSTGIHQIFFHLISRLQSVSFVLNWIRFQLNRLCTSVLHMHRLWVRVCVYFGCMCAVFIGIFCILIFNLSLIDCAVYILMWLMIYA